MTKALDSKDMMLRDVNSFSSSQIVKDLKPELGKVAALAVNVDKILSDVAAMDVKFTSGLAAVKCDVLELGSQAENHAGLAESQSGNIVRHLTSLGMVDVGSSVV